MTPERAFQLNAVAAFLDGVLKDEPGTGYVILLAHADEKVTCCTNISPVDVQPLLRQAADDFFVEHLAEPGKAS